MDDLARYNDAERVSAAGRLRVGREKTTFVLEHFCFLVATLYPLVIRDRSTSLLLYVDGYS